MADIQEVMRKRIQAMNDVFGIEPEQIRAGLTPFDVISAGGRTIDAFTGAPTRAAIGAAITGENPITAAGKQFGANPELAPSYGPIEDFVLDPGLMLGAVNPAKLGTRLAALNELGAVGPNVANRLRANEIRKMLDQVLQKDLSLDLPKHFGSGSYSYAYDIGKDELVKVPRFVSDEKIQTFFRDIPKKAILAEYGIAPEFNFGIRNIEYGQGIKKVPYVVEKKINLPGTIYGQAFIKKSKESPKINISEKRFENLLNRIAEAGLEPEDISGTPNPRNWGVSNSGKLQTYDPGMSTWNYDVRNDPKLFREEIEKAMPRYVKLYPNDPGDYEAFKILTALDPTL